MVIFSPKATKQKIHTTAFMTGVSAGGGTFCANFFILRSYVCCQPLPTEDVVGILQIILNFLDS